MINIINYKYEIINQKLSIHFSSKTLLNQHIKKSCLIKNYIS